MFTDSHLIDQFLAELTAAGRSRSTTDSYRSMLATAKSAANSVHGRSDLLSLSRADIVALYPHYSSRYSSATAALHLRTLCYFYRYCAAVEAVSKSPMDSLPRPKGHKRDQVYMSTSEFVDLLELTESNCVWPERARLVLTLAASGLRFHELLPVSFDQLTASQRPGGEGIDILGKGDKSRWIPVSSSLRLALDQYLPTRTAILEKWGYSSRETDRLLVAMRPNFRLADEGATRMELVHKAAIWPDVARAFRAAGHGSGVGLHSLRRGFVTVGASKGGPFDNHSVQTAVGHWTGLLGNYRYVSREELRQSYEDHPYTRAAAGVLKNLGEE